MTQTLGDILRNEMAEHTSRNVGQQLRAGAVEAIKAAHDQAQIQQYFVGLSAQVLTSITTYKRVPVIEQGRHGSETGITRLLGLQQFFHKQTCMDSEHPAHGAWKKFQEWAATEGLTANWHQEHGRKTNDAGYPEEHWWVLEMKPVEV